MWNAVGNCYEKMDKKQESVKCFERAEHCKDKEGIALHMLAKLYAQIGYQNKALLCFQLHLSRKDADSVVDKETAECLLYLASHYKDQPNMEDKALLYARRLLDFNGPERDKANQIISSIN